MSRRDFLRVGGAVAGLVATGALPSCGRGRPLRVVEDPFALGIGSGDPTADGVVLWTRLTGTGLRTAAQDRTPIEARWEVADDERFSSIVRAGDAIARPELGYSVHVEVEGLRPGRGYFYRFVVGGEASAVGRTRTTPAPGAPLDRLRFAFASCQHYETGWYTALRHLASEDVDLVVHLGDYIYEGAPNPRVRAHDGAEIVSLDDYRGRYTGYRSDPDLQAAHLVAPWIVTWDDHEVDNDYAGVHPEDDQSPEEFLLRRAAAYQAYYEFMPLRRASIPAGPDMLLYRRFGFGDLLEMSVLDTRQYRSDQPCGGEPGPTCPEHFSPERTILGAEQLRWLLAGMGEARARWNVLAQQVMVARLRGFDDEDEETWSMDKWDGYPVERRAVLEALAASRVPNPVVLTGDIHSNWVADLRPDFDDPDSPVVATELVGTSISSSGDGSAMTPGGARMLTNNDHIRFYNGQRGYVLATVTPELWTSDFRIVPYVSEPGAPLETAASFVIEAGRPGAVRS